MEPKQIFCKPSSTQKHHKICQCFQFKNKRKISVYKIARHNVERLTILVNELVLSQKYFYKKYSDTKKHCMSRENIPKRRNKEKRRL